MSEDLTEHEELVGPLRAGRRRSIPRLNDFEKGWLAGLLEGEGYFGLIPSKANGKTYRYARVGVSMTDRDVVARAATLLDASVYTVRPSARSNLVQYRVVVTGQRALFLMRLLYEHLGDRRRQMIDGVFAYEAERADPNECRRRWSSEAANERERDEMGRLLPSSGRAR